MSHPVMNRVALWPPHTGSRANALEVSILESLELRDLIVEALDDARGVEVVPLDVTALTDVTDHMVIATGTSSRHVRSIADRVVERCREHGERALGVEGHEGADWVLIDMTDVVVHVMTAAARELYDLERLWGDMNSDPRDRSGAAGPRRAGS